jgi:membrane protease subunit (stomatin/prohibitin family)
MKWGTPGPATMRDKEFGIVRATAFGIYAIRIKDPGIFIKDISGTEGRFTTDQIQENLRGKIGLRIKEVMPELGLSIIDLEAKVSQMGQMLRERISPDFEAMGLELVEVQVQDVGLPEEVEKAIDKRGAIAAVGNLQAYTQYETASSIHDAATTPNSAAGAGMGLGAGFAMGSNMVGQMGGAMAATAAASTAAAAAPPPLPPQMTFHVAINGAQAGPFDMNTLQGQIGSGALKRESLVWRAGMAQWAKAADVAELAALFAAVPPPLPPA